MQAISLIWSVLALIGMLVGFIPCLGWMNWFNIPFAIAGLIFSAVVLVAAPREREKTAPILAVVFCSMAVVIGFLRLIVGGGVV